MGMSGAESRETPPGGPSRNLPSRTRNRLILGIAIAALVAIVVVVVLRVGGGGAEFESEADVLSGFETEGWACAEKESFDLTPEGRIAAFSCNLTKDGDERAIDWTFILHESPESADKELETLPLREYCGEGGKLLHGDDLIVIVRFFDPDDEGNVDAVAHIKESLGIEDLCQGR